MADFSDIRAASIDHKRSLDHKFKWAHGVRPKSGMSWTGNPKLRPGKGHKKWPMPEREREKIQHQRSGKEEVVDPIFQDPARQFLQDLPALSKCQSNVSAIDTPLVDHSNSSGDFGPLPLDALVVKTGRETEQYVQNEFIILDDQGEMASGKKGIKILRKAEKSAHDFEGYELL